MAGGWPTTRRQSNPRAYGFTTASTTWVTLTSGTANTAGSFATIINPTVGDISGLVLHVNTAPVTAIQVSVTLAVGTAGANPVLTDLVLGGSASGIQFTSIYVPLIIPSGSILSAKVRSPTVSDVVSVAVTGFDDGLMGGSTGSAIDTIGFVAASTQGAAIDPGATIHTKGAYTQLVASTAVDYCAICFAFDGQGKTTGTSNRQFVDFALGAAASEVVILPNWPLYIYSGINPQQQMTPWFEMDIKAGQRLSARSQSQINTSPQRTIGITAYGLRA